MAKMRAPISFMLEGKVGAITFYTSEGRQISRASSNVSNYGVSAKRTTRQQRRRVRWANLVNFYKISQGWMYFAFESKKKGVSDYNKLMSLNVSSSKIALTRNQAASGACVVDSYQVTEGSLPPIMMRRQDNIWLTNIAIGLESITDTTTIAEFSRSVLASNSWMKENMQISFISYMQEIDSLGIPRVRCTPYELTLSKSSTETVRSYLPKFCSSLANGYLATSNEIATGCFTYILSLTENGKTLVSTQRLVSNNTQMTARFSSDDQLQLAVQSYSVNNTRFLESGSEPTDPTLKDNFIQRITIEGREFNESTAFFELPNTGDDELKIYFANPVKQVSSIKIVYATKGTPISQEVDIRDLQLIDDAYYLLLPEELKGRYLEKFIIVADGYIYNYGNGQYPSDPSGE